MGDGGHGLPVEARHACRKAMPRAQGGARIRWTDENSLRIRQAEDDANR